MKTIEKIWNWLDGKKTVIGSTLLFAANFLKPHTVAHQVCFYAGSMLAGTGTAHKLKKRELKIKS